MTDDKLAQDHNVDETEQAGTDVSDEGFDGAKGAAASVDANAAEEASVVEESAVAEHAPQYGVGPFSIREVALVGVWVVAFIVSFFSFSTLRFESVWTSNLEWILSIGVPTAAVFLIVLRRLSPQGIRRVGSLGIDQFASVAFTVSSVVWLQLVWETVAFAGHTGQWVRGWVIWVSLFLMAAGVLLTVFAPFISPIDEDFAGRDEVPAHRNARPIRPVSPRPAPVAVAADAPVANDTTEAQTMDADTVGAAEADVAEADAVEAAAEYDTDADATGAYAPEELVVVEPAIAESTSEVDAPVEADVAPAAEPARQQAFWALSPEERDVVDDLGLPLFRVGPTAWALVIEDRGTSFVVRHEDGRTGTLNDVSGVTRG
ncbi:hypothetical protein ACWPKO_22175 (plasmid) [Coraliomargarita sp. W4R53]